MNLITSFLFSILLNLWGIIIPILYCPTFITKNTKMADHGAKIWSQFCLFMLRKICRIDHRIIGLEKLPKNEAFIVACKHQSAWETIVMHLIFNAPAYCYKKELLNIPFYGWYLRVMTGIAIDREGGVKALKNLITQSKKCLSQNHNVIIFPQGTRVPVGATTDEYPYLPGIAALYNACNVKIVPASLNSGIFWDRKKILKKPGTITLEFLEPIAPGLPKKEFMALLEQKIENSSNQLCQIKED
jgi:1-acyl-sn-glycerol-3-phosphate acyltransferase